ncbi:peptide/nickel transport system ATP-binding protein/oligopeptide transport system ATP-binding protein [Humitalea rosea]|uniref:Peptide/nickel transport system ATP-binding protein/oligopeptide transport system ATP-binding protein n=1 Tax=Humitalea rosea TaxID=990373 RepID=A0A2W7HZD3_9PROT|nr:ABC transporter ATP-binding protein [Humitalea rosea]PZW39289.1 peptide/nickel transport system ATP-binding protein/oligopeptide transport system ATP-binding protein [Humitalea rosea]
MSLLADAVARAAPAQAAGAPVLRVEGLGVRIRTGRHALRALDDVGFSLRRAETLGLVGESGSGKTLTALALMRLVETSAIEIDRGQVALDGVDLLGLPERAMEDLRGRRISMIFQEPMTALNPVISIGRQIEEPLRRHLGTGRRAARDAAVALLDQVGIRDAARIARCHPHELSGGMRQRVTIAIAIACRPDVLVADEPTTALDVTVQAQILGLLRDLQAEMGMAMLLITHDLGVVAETAHRVAVMYAGRVVETAPVGALFRRPRHPYTRGLLRSIPRIARERPAALAEIPGTVPGLLALPEGCAFAARCELATAHCVAERPALERIGPEQAVACWRHQHV